jgi:hypothetical protein
VLQTRCRLALKSTLSIRSASDRPRFNGNLTQSQDLALSAAVTETFTYDSLNWPCPVSDDNVLS